MGVHLNLPQIFYLCSLKYRESATYDTYSLHESVPKRFLIPPQQYGGGMKMTQKKVCIGLIGAGKVSFFHGKGYLSMKDQVDVKVADVILENAKEKAAQIGAADYTSDYNQLLKDDTIDAVDICLPNHLHAPVSLEACEAGKHVLVEKPMANTVKEADEMVRAARKNGVHLMVVHSNRFLPVNQCLMKELPTMGALSWIHVTKEHIKCPGTWYKEPEKSGGGVLIDVGVHAADLILWCSPQKVRRVFATTAFIGNIPVEDLAFCQMELTGYVKASFFVTWAAPLSSNTLKVTGEKEGTATGITADMKGQQVILTGKEKEPVSCPQTEPETAMTVKAFVECVHKDVAPPITGEDGKKTLEVIEAAYRSAREQQWVIV